MDTFPTNHTWFQVAGEFSRPAYDGLLHTWEMIPNRLPQQWLICDPKGTPWRTVRRNSTS